jgi:putative spermidine/putrescine transport system permease protein
VGKRWWAYILMLPGLLVITIFLIIPIINTILPTFHDGERLTLSLYWDFLTDDYYQQILFRTLRIALLTVLFCIILGLPSAYFISKVNKKIRGVLIALTIFPLLTNAVVRSFAWITILGQNGVINNLLQALNLISVPIRLLYTEFAVIIGSIYLFLPLMIVSLVGVMENIDQELMEASESLGANRFVTFFKVVFPLSIPGLIVGSVLVFAGAASAYTTPRLLGGNRNIVLSTLLHQQATTLGNWVNAGMIALIMITLSVLMIKLINTLAAKINERGI